MDQYDLTVCDAKTGKPLFPSLQAGPSPFGSFNKGDWVDLRPIANQKMVVQQVGHSILPVAGGRVHRTILFVAPPEDKDHPVPWPW